MFEEDNDSSSDSTVTAESIVYFVGQRRDSGLVILMTEGSRVVSSADQILKIITKTVHVFVNCLFAICHRV